MPTLTIFTATYNRLHLIDRLYHSLQRQTCKDFEWLVVDDGSTDGTSLFFDEIVRNRNGFPIRYFKQVNKGLIRSLNFGIVNATGVFFSKIDSDDYVVDDYVSTIIGWTNSIRGVNGLYAVGGLKITPDGIPLKGVWPKIPKDGFIDATDLERKKYDMDADLSEAWRIDILKQYPFPIWPTEKFAPEQIVLHQIAIDGYKIRWYPKPLTICEYQEGGLTKGATKLEKENPMGYAMMYNHMMSRPDLTRWQKYKSAMNFIALSFVGKNPGYILHSKKPLLSIIAFPFGLLLAVRRYLQYQKV